MAGEIAAVDRRYVLRLERIAVLRVVPVVEVAAETLEGVHRLERGLETLDSVERADPAEIARGHRGQQVQSDVRGRRAMRHHRARSEEHTSELQSPCNLVCRLLLEKKKKKNFRPNSPKHKKVE